ncbi:MAG: serine--tRNA ligase [Myxococcales bacterium]|nr:serine--tRNA ligase [Myxococcales bacterium]|tara:strand:- start:317 stop:1594 length:1278 start_codon:yes stop_codon:yes gene_type:complete
MLDIQLIRENTAAVKEAVRRKKFQVDIDELLDVDRQRLTVLADCEQLRAQRNEVSARIPKMQGEEKQAAIADMRSVRETLGEKESALRDLEIRFETLMLSVPGLPVDGIPDGTGDEDNVEVRRVGELPEFDFEPLDHVSLCKNLGLADFERAARFAGGRSYLLTGHGAMLEYAVTRFAMDHLMGQGFTPVVAPLLVTDKAMVGTGFFPLGREDTYAMEKDELYLVGTSEVPLCSIHREEILDADSLPKRYAGWSTCFRREAGSYGKDTRGLYRVHQFQKVEQVSIIEADEALSLEEHHRLLGNSEEILQALGMPYRVAVACTGELGMGQARKHEIESWMPSRQAYCETHSCSSLHDFQARRSKIRYRPSAGEKPRFCHTLNNTAIASPRILIPLLENNQRADGSVVIPEVLRPYMNGLAVLEPHD